MKVHLKRKLKHKEKNVEIGIGHKRGENMKKILMVLIALVVFVGTSSSVMAHSGRTDKNGGHNCSAKSKQKGLCSGYHYHNKKK